ncbi:hypothetical protein PROFUN_10130 [Planoprotostelium fungivorum]|uniref:Uncharacterized protein n=1 Tax=Planoprotostelium fungivorum TaxID=1890364 RepID=A0A2P6NEP6_9EUKA|nr:hypothetical protein PROFUN_10130 [Planoprotostelium fungivorum]
MYVMQLRTIRGAVHLTKILEQDISKQHTTWLVIIKAFRAFTSEVRNLSLLLNSSLKYPAKLNNSNMTSKTG